MAIPTARLKSLTSRMRKTRPQSSGPRLMTIHGDPEVRKLKDLGRLAPLAMGSNREAMIDDTDYYVAGDDEPTKAFHSRLLKIAQERGVPRAPVQHRADEDGAVLSAGPSQRSDGGGGVADPALNSPWKRRPIGEKPASDALPCYQPPIAPSEEKFGTFEGPCST